MALVGAGWLRPSRTPLITLMPMLPVKQGFFPLKLHVEKPGVEAEDFKIYGYEWIAEPLEKPVLGYILPTMTGICSVSKNPERALMF